MISPYLRRPLRSLDEIRTQGRDGSASQKKPGAVKLPGAVAGAPARAADTPEAGAGRRTRLRPFADPSAA